MNKKDRKPRESNTTFCDDILDILNLYCPGTVATSHM